MALIVEVTRYKGVPLLSPQSARFDESGGSIGRSFDNHLALPDEDKIISRHHGDIRYENGVFVYTDTSTGGTMLCNENRLLENGVSITLAEGDQLKVGEFELHVRIENGEQSFPGLFPGLGDSQAFGGRDDEPVFDLSIPPLLFTDSEPSPVFAQAVSPQPPVVNDSFINQPDAPSFRENFTPPGIQSPPEEFSFDGILRGGPVLPQATQPNAGSFEFPDDWFGDLGLDPVADGNPSTPASKPSHQLTPMPVAQEGNFSEFPLSAALVDEIPNSYTGLDSPPLSPTPRLGTPAPLLGDQDQTGHTLNAPANPVLSEDKVGNVGLEPFAGTSTPVIDLPQPGRSIPPSRMAAAVSDPANSPPQPFPAPSPAATAKATDLFQCFLQGAGLAEFPQLTEQEQEEAMKALGEVYRDTVEGMMMVLRARSEEKREIRTDVTLIRKQKNNPLKFIPTVEDAMKVMISRKYSGYIDAPSAVREGFADIMKHQMAMRAGMQMAVGEILRRFEPAAFEKPFEEGIVFQKKAKCWDAYAKAYPQAVTEAMDNLFGDTFAKAYEGQMRMLRDSHDKG
jgi:type VI secretion system protein